MFKPTRIIIISASLCLMAGCKMTQENSQQNAGMTADGLSTSNQSVQRAKADTAKINAQLGIAYLEQKNVQRAKQKLLLALKQDPTIPEPWYSMAYFLEATGNSVEAQKYYLRAVEVAPGRGDAQNNYGTFLCRSGQYKESIKHFMVAANTSDYLDPAAAYENAGLCAMKIPAYKQAAEYFNQALLKDPARTLSLLKLADVDLKLGKLHDAKGLLTQYSLVATPTPEYHQLVAKLDQQLSKQTG
jgi:type IV pilus assembly protein PilF